MTYSNPSGDWNYTQIVGYDNQTNGYQQWQSSGQYTYQNGTGQPYQSLTYGNVPLQIDPAQPIFDPSKLVPPPPEPSIYEDLYSRFSKELMQKWINQAEVAPEKPKKAVPEPVEPQRRRMVHA